MREFARGVLLAAKVTWRADPSRAGRSIALMLLGAISAPLAALAFKQLTDAALDGQLAPAALAGATVALLALLSMTLEFFAHLLYFELADLAQVSLEEQLAELAHSPAPFANGDRGDWSDQLDLLRRESRELSTGVESILQGAALIVQVALSAVLLATVNPLLLALPIVALPSLWIGAKAQARLEDARDAAAIDVRRAGHLLEASIDAVAAKEIRIFGLQGELRSRQRRLWGLVQARLLRGAAGAAMLRMVGEMILGFCFFAALFVAVDQAIAGRASVGDVVLATTLLVQVHGQASRALQIAQSLHRSAMTMTRMAKLNALVERLRDGTATRSVPPRILRGIELQSVSFRYPASARPVLSDLNVRIPAGSTVAVVGENGSGKSTLVKLLLGFYEPSSGTIALDGVNLREFSAEAWCKRTAACFQDFTRFELTALENVGIGDAARMQDPVAIAQALRRSQANELVASLENGLDTALGDGLSDGVDLSAGQWQRLALGRAMMRDDPLVVVLDEPGSALDAFAEHDLLDRYSAEARRASAAHGTITVFVSHRFSTVRMADLILVLQQGRLIEHGSHAELIASRGIYADLFAVQADAYR